MNTAGNFNERTRKVFVVSGCRPYAAPTYSAIIGRDVASGEFFLYEMGLRKSKYVLRKK